MEKGIKTKDKDIDEMFSVGAHFGYSKQRRHPSIASLIFGRKNDNEIIDITKTKDLLEKAEGFVREIAASGKVLLFVGNKPEAQNVVRKNAEVINMPYVAGRWIGGTITNFSEIKKRTQRLINLKEQKKKGELDVYTKKEQGIIAKEVEDLEKKFSGIIDLERIPDVMYVVDSREENIAVTEAKNAGIPVISLSSSDCNISDIDYPIVANDSSVASIEYFTKRIASSYKEGQGKQKTIEKKDNKGVKEKIDGK